MSRQKEKAVLPKLRFPEFRDAGPWEVKRLGDIGTITKGKGISKSDIKLGGATPCIRYGELYTLYGEVIREVVSYTDANPAELVLSEGNDVIIPSSGETKEDIATASCVTVKGAALGGDLNIFRSALNGAFLAYYVRGNLKSEISKVAQGDSVVHLYPTQLEKLKLAVPPTSAEQQKIADCLSSLDDLIRAEEGQLATLKDHKKGLMQQLFPREGETTPRLRFPEFRDAGPWEVKRLGEVIELAYGAALPESRRRVGTIPVLGSNGVVGYHNEPLTRGPTIVIGRKGSAGEVVWVEEDCFPIDTTFYVQFRSPQDDPRFVYFLLVKLNLPELARAEGVPGLNRNDVYSIKVGIPRSEEQQKIADCLSSLDDLIRAKSERIDALKQHKKGLMQQLFPQEVD